MLLPIIPVPVIPGDADPWRIRGVNRILAHVVGDFYRPVFLLRDPRRVSFGVGENPHTLCGGFVPDAHVAWVLSKASSTLELGLALAVS